MAYYVKYIMHRAAEEKGICIVARNKIEAYDKAVYKAILKTEGGLPYAAWVYSVTYNNGKYKKFNTFAGKPY